MSPPPTAGGHPCKRVFVRIYLSQNILRLLTVLIVAVILLLCIITGWSSGKKYSEAETVYKNTASLNQALNFFYSDQNRFPTALEFAENNLMLNYLTAFPPIEFISSNCQQSYVYKRNTKDSFQLSFCLPTALLGFNKGWNTIAGSPQ